MFAEVKTVSLPEASLLQTRVISDDFVDAYACDTTLSLRDAAETAMRFPRWTYVLLGLRQIIMLPFGLKGKTPGSKTIGIFPVRHETANELILGFDDKHLDFRISVHKSGTVLTTSTWVRRHNLLGRVYLKLIMPFHIFIVKQAVARVARASH